MLTLGMGIGATTAIFSAVHAILLAPLPFREPQQLVRVMRETQRGTRTSSSGGDFLEFQRTTRTLSGLTSYFVSTGNLVGFGPPQRVQVARTSHNFLDVLGIPLLLGRKFTADEDTYKAAEVALLSEGSWRRLFGADPDVVGRTVRMDGQAVQIIGVVREGRGFPEGVELWLPAKYEPGMMADDNRGASFLRLIGRLAPGTTLEQANAEFRAMSRSISERFPDERSATTSTLTSFEASLVGDVRGPLWILLGTVVLVLLVACTNVAALLLGRVMARDHELSIWASLGAGRGRLIRQLLTESTTLGVIGAAAGAAIAVGLVRLLVNLAPYIPRIGAVRVNAPMLAFSIGLGILTGLVFGVVPAWQASRRDLQVHPRGGGRGQTGSLQAGRIRGALVIGQFAMAIILLAGAGLLVRTFLEMRAVDPGVRHTQCHDVHRHAAPGWFLRRHVRRDCRPAPVPAPDATRA
ncbi:MAG: ABC transporter permease [Gemmatimonadaceae bacterium]